MGLMTSRLIPPFSLIIAARSRQSSSSGRCRARVAPQRADGAVGDRQWPALPPGDLGQEEPRQVGNVGDALA